MHRKVVAACMAGILMSLSVVPVSASTLSKAKNAKTEAESDLNSQNEKISSLQNEQAQLQSEMNSLDAQLSEVLVNIQILSDEITQKQAELEDVGNQLVQAQQNEQTEYEDMKLRIQYMYENGDSTMLQSLLESKDISDFVNRAEYVNSVYSYDRNLLIQYQQTVQQVADLQIQVQGEEAELEEIQESYEEQETQLQTVIAEKQSQMSDFDTQLANAKNLAAQYAATIEQQNEIIRQEQERQALEASTVDKVRQPRRQRKRPTTRKQTARRRLHPQVRILRTRHPRRTAAVIPKPERRRTVPPVRTVEVHLPAAGKIRVIKPESVEAMWRPMRFSSWEIRMSAEGQALRMAQTVPDMS